jgi:hypothetical protein
MSSTPWNTASTKKALCLAKDQAGADVHSLWQNKNCVVFSHELSGLFFTSLKAIGSQSLVILSSSVESCRSSNCSSHLKRRARNLIFNAHLGRVASGGFKPAPEIPYLHTMLDFRLSDAYQDAGSKS